MRKIIILLILLACLAGCGTSATNPSESKYSSSAPINTSNDVIAKADETLTTIKTTEIDSVEPTESEAKNVKPTSPYPKVPYECSYITMAEQDIISELKNTGNYEKVPPILAVPNKPDTMYLSINFDLLTPDSGFVPDSVCMIGNKNGLFNSGVYVIRHGYVRYFMDAVPNNSRLSDILPDDILNVEPLEIEVPVLKPLQDRIIGNPRISALLWEADNAFIQIVVADANNSTNFKAKVPLFITYVDKTFLNINIVNDEPSDSSAISDTSNEITMEDALNRLNEYSPDDYVQLSSQNAAMDKIPQDIKDNYYLFLCDSSESALAVDKHTGSIYSYYPYSNDGKPKLLQK